ncbi:MAG: DUF3943 domain-containing protein [Nitrospirae bacterium]|nr:DUF3943 domain-containing protein [Nitrospirota bacterium]
MKSTSAVRGAPHRSAIILLLASLALPIGSASASDAVGLDEPGWSITGEPTQERRFWQGFLELFFLNGLGEAQYWIRREVNIPDWKYQPTWDGMKEKVSDGWAWDTNAFRTNSVYHAYSGSLYYQIGRANGYGPLGSTVWAFGGSLMWEYVGEYREQVSTNDMIITTFPGALMGEALRQLSYTLEQRAPRNYVSTFFVHLFDPFRKINEYLDHRFPRNHFEVRFGLFGQNRAVGIADHILAGRHLP